MPTYLTVKELAEIFRTTEKTVRRWIDEGKEIRFDGRYYAPQKDPGGNWLFVVHLTGETQTQHIVVTMKRRRVLSSGIK